MNGKPSPQPALWQLMLVLAPILWCMGFFISYDKVSGTRSAFLKATAFTLSGIVGWAIYRLISRRSYMTSGVAFLGLNVTMLNPTRTPWPFWRMLAHGLIVSVLAGLLVGLVSRLLPGVSSLAKITYPIGERIMPKKEFRLRGDQIKPLATNRGGCMASDMIPVEGYKVGFMYREDPNNELDSGWRFMSGLESQEYMDNAANHAVYDLNTIANYDPDIIPLLDASVGSAFERDQETGTLIRVE